MHLENDNLMEIFVPDDRARDAGKAKARSCPTELSQDAGRLALTKTRERLREDLLALAAMNLSASMKSRVAKQLVNRHFADCVAALLEAGLSTGYTLTATAVVMEVQRAIAARQTTTDSQAPVKTCKGMRDTKFERYLREYPEA
jgi:1,6-anhydro-N-acetylmuramate kinase